jgi:hypothetical protein
MDNPSLCLSDFIRGVAASALPPGDEAFLEEDLLACAPVMSETQADNDDLTVMPSYLLKPIAFDPASWRPVLAGSGYGKESRLAFSEA